VFDFSRYRGPFAVALSVAAVLFVVNLALGALTGRSTKFLEIDGEKPTDWAIIEHVGSQLSAVVTQKKHEDVETNLGVLLGQSTAEEGIDVEILDREMGLPLRWLGLCGSGGSLIKIDELAQLFYRSGLKPKVVLLVVGPEMLAGVPNPPLEEPASFQAILTSLKSRKLAEAKRQVQDRVWMARNSLFINHDFRHLLFQTRLQWLGYNGLNVDAIFPPDKEPWTLQPAGPFERTPEKQAQQLEEYEAFGWFRPEKYTGEGENARALVDLIRRCRDLGSYVLLVMMPARSNMRQRLPAEARGAIRHLVVREFGDQAPSILDLWDVIPDEEFRDHLHVNWVGREKISRILAARLHDLLAPHVKGLTPIKP
jgi:hypothetical protein